MVVRCFFKNIIRTKSHCFHPKLLIPINFVEKNFFRHSPDGSRFPRNFLLPSAIVVVQLKITSEMFVTKKAWKWRGLWLNRGGKERDLRWQQGKKNGKSHPRELLSLLVVYLWPPLWLSTKMFWQVSSQLHGNAEYKHSWKMMILPDSFWRFTVALTSRRT